MSPILVFAALLAVAQDDPPPVSMTTITASTDDSIRVDGRRDDGAGHVTVTQAKLSLEFMHIDNFRDFYRVSAAAERIGYDFEKTDEIDTAVAYRTDASWVHVFDQTWTGFVYGSLLAELELGADLDESLGGSLGTGFMYRSSETLTLGLVLHARFPIDKTPQLWPLPYIDWKISDRMTLATEQKAGFGYTLTYGLTDPAEDGSFAWAAVGRARFQARRMRLDDGGFNPEGIMEDHRFTIDVLLRHEFDAGGRRASIGLYLGVEAWQIFEVETRRGHGLDTFNTYAKPVVGITGSLEF